MEEFKKQLEESAAELTAVKAKAMEEKQYEAVVAAILAISSQNGMIAKINDQMQSMKTQEDLAKEMEKANKKSK